MRKALLLAACLSLTSHLAHAKNMTSDQLITFCSAYSGPQSALSSNTAAYCVGYIGGVAETLSLIKTTNTAFCLPAAVNKNQLVFVVKSYMDGNAGKLNQPVPIIIYNALVQSFPCA
jgi:hypothetical protein